MATKPDLPAFLEQHTRKGISGLWHCINPSHPDRNPSMSVFGSDGVQRWHCHGCGQGGDVFDAMDLLAGQEKGTSYRAWKGVQPSTSGNGHHSNGGGAAPDPRRAPAPGAQPVAQAAPSVTWAELEARWRARPGFEAVYLYRDGSGVPVMAVARLVNVVEGKRKKDFPTAHAGPDGRWRMGEPAGLRPLYRLAELRDGPVWIVEGEKAADAGAALGLNVTTTSCGAGKAAKTDLSPLRGRLVYILPDNDPMGIDHAAELERLLKALGARARVVHLPGLPAKGDLADWIAAAGDAPAPELLQRLHGFGRTFRLQDLGDVLMQREPGWIIRGILPDGGLGVIAGAPKSGKSFTVLDMALCACQGIPWRGRRTKPGKWVYVCAEGSGRLKRRAEAWYLFRNGGKVPNGFWVLPEAVQFDLEQAQALVDDLRDDPPQVVVIDTLARCMPGDENATGDMNAFVAAIGLVQQALGCAVLVVHHTGHAEKHRARGSSALMGAVDVAIICERLGTIEKPTTVLQLKCAALKDAEPFETISLELKVVSICDDRGMEMLDDDGEPVTSCVLEDVSAKRLAELVEEITDAKSVRRGATPRGGRPAAVAVHQREQRILDALAEGQLTTRELEHHTELSGRTLRRDLRTLVEAGDVVRLDIGNVVVYRLPEEPES